MTAKTTTKSEPKQNATLSPPWCIFYREVQALFGGDEEIKLFYNESENEIKFFVDNATKAEALAEILPEQIMFGNVVLNISIVPANTKKVKTYQHESVFDIAFRDNPAYSYSKTYTGVFTNPITYVVFRKKVVQYYTDNLGDINGICSTLYQDIAKDVLAPTDVYYCTDIDKCHPPITVLKPMICDSPSSFL